MNDGEFDAVVDETMARLPEWVREAFDNIDLLILDEADEDLDPDGDGLLGLYVGTPLPERDANHAGELPDVVYLFRRPHLELGVAGDELKNEIATTLVHEIAHYFGIDDDRLHELGWG
jgi:predicted Zn-dependent protease with MMP-like domain